MELILLLSSSGVAGLLTYIYLDYLSFFDTEKNEIKKMISIMFSLVNISIFFLVQNSMNLLEWGALAKNLITILLALFIILILNVYVYPKMFKIFRKYMNKQRISEGFAPYVESAAIDSILQKNAKFYIERYNNIGDEPVYHGILNKHELTENLDSIFVIEPTPKIKDNSLISFIYIYQPSNTDYYFKIYQIID
ncbi:hypothetical protein BUZ84_05730 [Mammaliicoccus sciuri]|uniref:hypothetical protein n=1 Tax=Mammaliicoccus sciuri TaxID=1296 RepID=UPI000D1F5282|nr:hypothetical protein [Mammaliicoccus sciuri]PTJ81712.1 hypothetical protein BUZ84_05730 [Mammaliicoccus sciuri]